MYGIVKSYKNKDGKLKKLSIKIKLKTKIGK